MAKLKPKQCWKIIKKQFINSKTVKSNTLTAADLFEHFKLIYGNEPDPSREQPQDPTLHESQINADIEISENELKNAVVVVVLVLFLFCVFTEKLQKYGHGPFMR